MLAATMKSLGRAFKVFVVLTSLIISAELICAQEQVNNATEPAAAAAATTTPTTKTTTDIGQPSRRQYAGQQLAEDEYLVGVGIADITGPAADINLVSLIRLLADAFSSSTSSTGSGSAGGGSAASGGGGGGSAAKSGRRRQSVDSKAASSVSDNRTLKLLEKADKQYVVDKKTNAKLEYSLNVLAKKASEGRIIHMRPWPPPSRAVSPLKSRLVDKNNSKQRSTTKRDDKDDSTQRHRRQSTVTMGYAKPNQDAGGIHLRQFSRSLMIEDRNGDRVLYINLDNGMISQLLRTNVLNLLEHHYGSALFNETNVMLTATHTHSCPGGFFQYMLYNIPSAGFIKQTLDALSDGILRSVQRAVASVQPASLHFIKGELLDASINRSPTAYANNPAAERASYKHDTDKEMFLLRIVDRKQSPLAVLNWFAVHGTSMNNSNHLISSDNKGYAALLFEQAYNPAGTLPGKGKFVAIFAQANEGDVSPNTRGPRCVDTGLPCDPVTSTCGTPPRNEKCIAFGPGRDMFESTQMIAYKQYYKAKQLFEDTRNQQRVRGPVRHVHQHIDMTKQIVPAYESAALIVGARQRRMAERRAQQQSAVVASRRRAAPIESAAANATLAGASAPYHTCTPAMGYSFAAGTTDGPGAFDFAQGDTVSTRYWNMVRDFLKRPSPDSIKCQHPKPILLATGEMDFPYMWHPKVVPTQVFMIGQLAIVGLPGEFTTMAGRRVREAVRRVLSGQQSSASATMANEDKQQDPLLMDATDGAESLSGAQHGSLQRTRQQVEVVLSGLSNIYTSYITTIEEYEMQRYEGGSTLYGPHTLQAYVHQFERLAASLLGSQQPDDSLRPPDLSKSLFTLKAGVIFDGAPHGTNFGSLVKDASATRVYTARDRVIVSFVAGNPRNDLRQEESFLYVEQFNASSRSWTVVATDSSWETKFIWERTNTLFGESRATIEWEIPLDCTTGIYRIRHVGTHKNLLQTVSQYSGMTSVFKVAASQAEAQDQATAEQLEAMRLFVERQEINSDNEADTSLAGSIQRQTNVDMAEPKSESGKRSSIMASILAPLRAMASALLPRRIMG